MMRYDDAALSQRRDAAPLREPMVAQGLTAAAGLRGKQNWALILSSSARVSEVTYERVVAVRYPELDAYTPTGVTFGNYLADRQSRIGGYLPIFWRSPHSVIHAAGDIGQMIGWISQQLELEAGENGCLAVLHNRNDMSGTQTVGSSPEGSHRVRE